MWLGEVGIKKQRPALGAAEALEERIENRTGLRVATALGDDKLFLEAAGHAELAGEEIDAAERSGSNAAAREELREPWGRVFGGVQKAARAGSVHRPEE